jgi:hypothetical protein
VERKIAHVMPTTIKSNGARNTVLNTVMLPAKRRFIIEKSSNVNVKYDEFTSGVDVLMKNMVDGTKSPKSLKTARKTAINMITTINIITMERTHPIMKVAFKLFIL